MASLQDTIDILIHVNDQASAAIGGIGDALTGVDSKVQAIAAPLANVADKVLLAQGAITGLGAALVKTGVEEAGKFEQSFKFLTTLFDGSSESVSKFRQDILDYASSSTQSLESITASLGEAIGAGVDYADSLGVLAEAEKLAIAQGATLDETTGLLTDTLQAYGLSMDDAAKLSDQFSVAIRDGKVSASELASQLSNVSPIAAAAGVGFDQVGSAIAVLTTQGFPAGQAITAIKAILEGIIRPTADASKYAGELGVSFGSAALKSDGLQGVLQKVFEATDGNVDAMARLFTSSEALGGALALGGNGAEKFKEVLLNMAKATGTTDEAFAKMGGTIEAGAQKIENALKVAFVNLGTPLLDELSGIQGEVAAIFSALGKEFTDGGALRPITQALEDLGVDIKDVLSGIAKNLPEALKGIDLTDLIGEYGKLGASIQGLFTDLFGDFDLTTVDGLRKAIQATIDTLSSLATTTRGIVDSFRPAAEAISETVTKFNALDKESKLDFGETIGSMKLIQEVGTGLGTALIAIGKAGVDMGVVLDGVFGAVKVAANSLQVTFDTVMLGLSEVNRLAKEAQLAWNESASRFDFSDEAKANRAATIADLKKDISEWETFSESIASNLDRNLSELSSGWNQMTGESSEKTEEWRARLNAAEVALNSVGSATGDAAGQIKGMTTEVKELTAQDISDANKQFDELTNSFNLLSDGLTNGLGGADVANQFKDIATKTAEAEAQAKGYRVTMEGGIPTFKQFKVVSSEINDEMSEAAKKAEEATKKSAEYLTKMEEIASNERIKAMEFTANIITTGLETDAERVKSVLEGLSTTIESTGETLSTLYGALSDAETMRDKWDIKDQIDIEQEARQKSLEQQSRLNELEIQRVEAQIRRLNQGDSMIKIEADGLEPEIEAFMWKILGKIQTRANASMQDYLLGIEAAT